MRYAGIKKFDIENGVGVGLTLFTQGCTKNCLGCHNPSTHLPNGGMEFTEDILSDIVVFFEENPQVKRFTLSGGDPLESLELSELVLKTLKSKFPYLKIWIYTGFTFEFLMQTDKYMSVLNICDVLVDGKFDISKKMPNLRFKGSSEQRIINVSESTKEKIKLLDF